MGKNEPIKLSSLISAFINQHNINDRLKFAIFKRNWKNIVGEAIANHTVSIERDGEKLTIIVDDPMWANELNLKKNEILGKINRWLNQFGMRVVSVKFRLK